MRNALVLLVVRRDAQPVPPPPGRPPSRSRAPDHHGIVGESAAAWRLRAEQAFAAATDHHVLLRGASGVGKELAARALHALSSRVHRPLVARNAATLPEGLVDAAVLDGGGSTHEAGAV